jgi:glucose-6-phosphate 1-dehydrogenase
MAKTENSIMIVFGASGDLTQRKLIPAVHFPRFEKDAA